MALEMKIADCLILALLWCAIVGCNEDRYDYSECGEFPKGLIAGSDRRLGQDISHLIDEKLIYKYDELRNLPCSEMYLEDMSDSNLINRLSYFTRLTYCLDNNKVHLIHGSSRLWMPMEDADAVYATCVGQFGIPSIRDTIYQPSANPEDFLRWYIYEWRLPSCGVAVLRILKGEGCLVELTMETR